MWLAFLVAAIAIVKLLTSDISTGWVILAVMSALLSSGIFLLGRKNHKILGTICILTSAAMCWVGTLEFSVDVPEGSVGYVGAAGKVSTWKLLEPGHHSKGFFEQVVIVPQGPVLTSFDYQSNDQHWQTVTLWQVEEYIRWIRKGGKQRLQARLENVVMEASELSDDDRTLTMELMEAKLQRDLADISRALGVSIELFEANISFSSEPKELRQIKI